MTWVPGWAASALTSSVAARTSRRSGTSMKSSTTPRSARVHSSRRRPACGRVHDEVHRAQLVGRWLRAYRSAAKGGQVKAVHQHEHGPAGVVRRLGRLRPVPDALQHLGLRPVLAVQADEGVDRDREHHHDQPGALGELHDREDHHHKRRVDPAREVDHAAAAPAGLLDPGVVSGHPEAGHGEPGEDADRVERHQVVGVGPRPPAAAPARARPAPRSRWRTPGGGRAWTASGAGTSPRPRSWSGTGTR